MNGSPVLFQMAMAVVAIGGASAVTQAHDAGRPQPQAVFTFQDSTIGESSGLVSDGDHVLTMNDSGAGPEVYVVDRSTGETVGRTTYSGDEVVDVEAMAPGLHHTLWVGDIGDNSWNRTSVAVYELPMPTAGDRTVQSRRYDLVYQDGPRDAETLVVQPRTGRLYVVSKGLFGGKVYAAPPKLSTDHANVLRPVAGVGGLITDGAFFPDGRHVALRSYGNLTVLATKGWRDVDGMKLPDQQQGEGLAMEPSGHEVLLSSEGAGTDVLRLPLSKGILARTAPPEPEVSASGSLDAGASGRQASSSESSEPHPTPWWQAAALAAVTLAAALAVRALFRRRT